MDVGELKLRLSSEGFKPVYYVINEPPREGALRLYVFCGKWFIDYMERGVDMTLEQFDSEDAACRAMYRILSQDNVISKDKMAP